MVLTSCNTKNQRTTSFRFSSFDFAVQFLSNIEYKIYLYTFNMYIRRYNIYVYSCLSLQVNIYVCSVSFC